MSESVRCVLLDIEGTTSSISFVYDVMFAYVRNHLHGFLEASWNEPNVQAAVAQMAVDAGQDLNAWLSSHDPKAQVEKHVCGLMDVDSKSTGLKALQGIMWKSGFESGQMEAHVYPDVFPALQAWKNAGIDIRIYSSGSIAAQKLFFGHSIAGNLLPFFSDHYDTTIGGKKEADSYRTIAKLIGIPAGEILFISDVEAELDAATQAGLQVLASVRPGNKPLSTECKHHQIEAFPIA